MSLLGQFIAQYAMLIFAILALVMLVILILFVYRMLEHVSYQHSVYIENIQNKFSKAIKSQAGCHAHPDPLECTKSDIVASVASTCNAAYECVSAVSPNTINRRRFRRRAKKLAKLAAAMPTEASNY